MELPVPPKPSTAAISEAAKRHRRGQWTEAEILAVAAHRDFVVSKYRWSHASLRKKTRRMVADGKLFMVLFDGRQFYYRTKDENRYE